MIWLLASGQPLTDVAGATGYSTRWIHHGVDCYNADGPDGWDDRQHGNPGGAPVQDAAGPAAFTKTLAEPPPDGGLWTGAKVVAWITKPTVEAEQRQRRIEPH